MTVYRWQRVRKFLGGKWGRVTGLFFGKKWVRLNPQSVEWDENWDMPRDCIRWRAYIFRIDDDGQLLRRHLGDPSETWYVIARVE